MSLEQSDIPHFEEQGRVSPTTLEDRISDQVYSNALDHLVIACVDVAFTYQGKVLLVKRNRYPRRSWWVVGGRMIAGEAPKQTAIRKVLRELSLQIDASRLQYVGVYSTCFAFRHQAPQHHGSHTLNLTYQTELTPLEQETIELHPDEHEIWQWVEMSEVSHWLDRHQEMDRALLQVIQDLRW